MEMSEQTNMDLIDMKEAMEILEVSRTTFYRWMKDGLVRGKKVGGQWRFEKSSIEKVLNPPVQAEPRKDPSEDLFSAIRIYKDLLAQDQPTLEALKGILPDFDVEEPGLDGVKPSEMLFDLIVAKAVMDEVSDIHLEPFREGVRVRQRDTGVLYQVAMLPKGVMASLLSEIKSTAGCDPAKLKVPQDGKFQRVFGEKEVIFRVSFFPLVESESVVIRILDKGVIIPPLNQLGMNPADLSSLKTAINGKSGLIIVTGPTGCGKTTAIYSCLREISGEARNILTIEDPVEVLLDNVNQSQVRSAEGFDFFTATRAMLRHDPDVIMVGEIRDEATANLVSQVAMTGHLVFTALHAADAAGAIRRLLDVGVEPYALNSSLALCASSRVVRKICDHCREKARPNDDILKKLGLGGDSERITAYKGKGCDRCHGTGYKGRTAIFEVLTPDDEIVERVQMGASASQIRSAAQAAGATSLLSEGLRKVKEGVTTLEEIANALS